jgi:fatty acid desaturase
MTSSQEGFMVGGVALAPGFLKKKLVMFAWLFLPLSSPPPLPPPALPPPAPLLALLRFIVHVCMHKVENALRCRGAKIS